MQTKDKERKDIDKLTNQIEKNSDWAFPQRHWFLPSRKHEHGNVGSFLLIPNADRG